MTLAATPTLAIITTDKGNAVMTCQSIQAGKRVVRGHPIATAPERTTTSFQVDWNRHVELDEPARLLNHSCVPNTGALDNTSGGYDFVALRAIAAGEEITWDYDTTEYDSIAVPHCRCGSLNCRGRTSGYRLLQHHSWWRPRYVASYLRARA